MYVCMYVYIRTYLYIYIYIYTYPNNPLRVPFDLHLPSDFVLGAAPARGPPLRSGALPGPARARGSGGGGTLQGAGGLIFAWKGGENAGKPMVEPLKPHEISCQPRILLNHGLLIRIIRGVLLQ